MKISPHGTKQIFYKKLVTDTWLSNYSKTGSAALKLLSGSMAPLIQTGDQIVISRVDPSHIAIGDILTFWKGDILVTHRVIRICKKESGLCFVERGDQHPHHSFIAAESVIGRVARINKGRHAVELRKLRWRIFNRTVGTLFLITFLLRLLFRRFPLLPRQVRHGGNKFLQALTAIKNKALNALFR